MYKIFLNVYLRYVKKVFFYNRTFLPNTLVKSFIKLYLLYNWHTWPGQDGRSVNWDINDKYMNITSNLLALELEPTIQNIINGSPESIINNLKHKHESITNGYIGSYLNLVSLLSILLTIFVIISKNPVVSVLFLIGLFFSIACYLLLIGINFVGLSYLLVYVGAVSILFLFILMLINVRISDLMTNNTNSISLVLIIAIFFSYPIQQILPTNFGHFTDLNYDIFNINDNKFLSSFNDYLNYLFNNNNSFYVTSRIWDGYLTEMTHITSIGNIMYTNYSMWLIITSIILLLAMVGTIVITIKNTALSNNEEKLSSSYNANVKTKY